MKLPPLRALPVFEAVARLNSFSRAAAELAITQSAVSHQIKQLEHYLGEPLFLRAGRHLSLTEEGRQYLDSVSSALMQIERASEQLRGQDTARLRLALFSSFAVRWLIPRLPALHRRHSDLQLVLEMTGDNPQLSDRIGDCFITIHRQSEAFTYEPLYRERLFPVCSRPFWRQWCDRLGTVPDQLTPAQLATVPLLSTYSIYDREGEDWRQWYAAAAETLAAPVRMQHFSHMLLALEAARYHQGVVLTNDYMLGAEDDRDNFVRLPCHPLVTGDSFYFAYKTSRRNEPAIRQLRRWLLDEAAGSGLQA